MQFSALTCIDPVSNLVEIALIESKSPAHGGMVFENTWLTRYPKQSAVYTTMAANLSAPILYEFSW